MDTATGSANLKFPSQDVMSEYLNNHHRLVYDDYLKEKGVIEKTAQVFANTTKTLREAQDCIVLILKSIGLGGLAAIPSLNNIEAAVKDCAAKKVFGSAIQETK